MDTRGTTAAEGVLVLCDVLLVLIFLVGTATNSLVLLVFYRRPALRTLSNRFVINLLVTNLASCCLLFPLILADNLRSVWQTADPSLCAVSDGIACSTCAASIFAVVLISVDQYSAVVDPLRYHTIINKGRSVGMIGGSWVLAAMLGVLGSLNLSSRPSNPSLWQSCSSTRTPDVLKIPGDSLFRTWFAFAYAVLVFLAPFAAITWIYVCIYSAAHRNSKRARRTGSGPPENLGYLPLPVRTREPLPALHPISILSRNRQRKLSSSLSSLQSRALEKPLTKSGQSTSLTNLSTEPPVSPDVAQCKAPYVLSSYFTHQQKLKFFLMQPNTSAYPSIACRPAMALSVERKMKGRDPGSTQSVDRGRVSESPNSRRCSTSSIPSVVIPGRSRVKPASTSIPSVLVTSDADCHKGRTYACRTAPPTPTVPRKLDNVPLEFRSSDLESTQKPKFFLGGGVTLSRAASVRSTSSNIVNSLKCRISNASLFRYREETRAARISVLVIVMALVCWLPYVAVLTLHAGAVTQVPRYISAGSLTTLSAAAFISPCLFAYRSQRIQREVRRVFGVARDPKGLGGGERGSGRARRKLTKKGRHLASNYSHTALELMTSLAEGKSYSVENINRTVVAANSGLLGCIGDKPVSAAVLVVDTCRSSFSSGASTQGTVSSGGTVSED